MTPEEYSDRQQLIAAAAAAYVARFGSMFRAPSLSPSEWLVLLQSMFPAIERFRKEAASLARRFYDSQRSRFFPGLARNDRPLEGYSFERFVKDMAPAQVKISQMDSPQDAVGRLSMQATRVVENAGRQQIIHAVEDDEALAELIDLEQERAKRAEEPREDTTGLQFERGRYEEIKRELNREGHPKRGPVRGWARVATGRETCAWCLMLVSRGPVYQSSESAGLGMTGAKTAKAFSEAEDLKAFFEDTDEYMEQWHPGCDCKVVPVFNRNNWPGKEASEKASRAWVKATKIAHEEKKDHPVHKAGQLRGQEFTENELAINALRRLLEHGDVSMAEFAAFAA